MTFLHEGALRGEADYRLESLRQGVPRRRPRRRPRRWRRADPLAAPIVAKGVVPVDVVPASLVEAATVDLAAVIDAHIHLPWPRTPSAAEDVVPQAGMALPGNAPQ